MHRMIAWSRASWNSSKLVWKHSQAAICAEIDARIPLTVNGQPPKSVSAKRKGSGRLKPKCKDNLFEARTRYLDLDLDFLRSKPP
mmetsp:Transcript_25516/g.58377  ORF Transcript_25516/g.58377 Transcript_25516/m.58377 type:complete len:85 (-) Transcript_25516:520-774(-)